MTLDEKLLTIFYSARAGAIPLQELARELGSTRAETIQRIESLQKLGYEFDAHPELGYQLLKSPDALIADDLRGRLNEPSACGEIGNRILVFEETSSTNDIAERMAGEGHAEGLVIFAESQTMGRGRLGRTWLSPSRQGLWFSVLLRPVLPLHSAQRLTVMSAVAIAAALRQQTGLPLRVKWPNDILCHGRKTAGILVELSAQGEQIRHAVVGIGIDVNLEKTEFPEWLQTTATSLKIEGGRTFHRPTLAAHVLQEINRCQSLLSDENFPMLLEEWLKLDETLGRQVSISRRDGKRLSGLASNLDADGALLIRTDEGRMERIIAGDVTLEKLIS